MQIKIVDVIPLELRPGHYVTLIKRLEDFNCDQKNELLECVSGKDFDRALKQAYQIESVQFWIDQFAEDMQEN